MLNTSVSNNSRMEMQVASGLIQKSHSESYFKCFHITSRYAKDIANAGGVILQMMICQDGYMMAEIVAKENYDKATPF